MHLYIAAILYTLISIYNRKLGLYLLLFLLPLYVLRFEISGKTSTWLEVIVAVSVLLWIVDLLKQRVAAPKIAAPKIDRRFAVAVIIFVASATLGMFVSENSGLASTHYLAFYLEPVLMFFVFKNRFDSKHDWHHAIFALALSVIGVSALAIYQKFTGWMIFRSELWANFDSRRVTSIFGYPNGIGLYVAPLIPLFTGDLIRVLKKIKEEGGRRNIFATFTVNNRMLHYIVITINFLAIASGLFALWFAKSTGALVALIGAVGAALIIYKKTRWFAVGAAVIGVIILITLPAGNSLRQELFLQDEAGITRRNLWSATADLLKEHPFVGAGIGAFRQRVIPYHTVPMDIYFYPHNIILNFWTEIGVVGLAAFLLIVIIFFAKALRLAARNSDLYNRSLVFASIASVLAILIHGLVDVPYIKDDLAIMFWFILSLGLHAATQQKVA